MIQSLGWPALKNLPLPQEMKSHPKKVFLGTVGHLAEIRSVRTKEMVSIYTLHGEVYNQIGHAYNPQKIYYDFMQSGPSDIAMH